MPGTVPRNDTSPSPNHLIPPQLHHKRPPLNSINQNKPTLKKRIMTPSPDKIHHAPIRLTIILRIYIKKANLFDARTGGILRHTTNIQDSEARAVVTLVGQSVNDKLVVVDGVGRAFVVSGLL